MLFNTAGRRGRGLQAALCVESFLQKHDRENPWDLKQAYPAFRPIVFDPSLLFATWPSRLSTNNAKRLCSQIFSAGNNATSHGSL
ncbi:MAG: hypothetical protein WAN35_18120 [Terracidiphilus sp.]